MYEEDIWNVENGATRAMDVRPLLLYFYVTVQLRQGGLAGSSQAFPWISPTNRFSDGPEPRTSNAMPKQNLLQTLRPDLSRHHGIGSLTLPLALLGLFLSLSSIGCSPQSSDDSNTTAVTQLGPAPDMDSLQKRLDNVLDFTLQKRRLNTEDHGAWQILHGVLAYQHEFPVQVGRDRKSVSAVEYILDGGSMVGWSVRPGDDLGDGRRGLRAIVEPGTKKGQGHADQWLAVLAQCGLPPDEEIKLGSDVYTMRDFMEQVQRDCPRNLNQEWSWTLIGLTSYLPTDSTWVANDGQEWSIERLLQGEIDQDIYGSACGGTHRLIGIAMALNQHLASGGELTGAWKNADDVVQQAINDARQYQNPDGSLSTNYFRRPGNSPDLAIGLGCTGHVLEFLVLAMNDQQLAEPWVNRAAQHLCYLCEQTQEVDLECGALYHAIHGLVLFRDRVYGPRQYEAYTVAEKETAEKAE